MSVRIMSLVFENTSLSSTEKLVMLALADHANDEGKSIYPSQDRVSRKTGLSRRTVNRTIKALIENKYLHRVGYKEERNNVLELEISIKSLFNTGVPEDHTSKKGDRWDRGSQGGVPEDHIKHHSNHQFKKEKTSEEIERDWMDYFSKISGVPVPYKIKPLASWYEQIGDWVDKEFTKEEIAEALKIADKDGMSIVRPASLTSFIVDMRAKRARGVPIDKPKQNSNTPDPYPEFSIVYDENGVAYNAKGEVVNV